MADHAGADTVQIGFNRGAMPHEMFIEQIRRFARDVLPASAGAPGDARAGDRRDPGDRKDVRYASPAGVAGP